jgi:hypothetical protein
MLCSCGISVINRPQEHTVSISEYVSFPTAGPETVYIPATVTPAPETEYIPVTQMASSPPEPADDEFVPVTDYIPSIAVELKYATKDILRSGHL